MLRAGVRVVAGSDSHHCRDVGVYRSVRLTAHQLAAATGTPA
jgi:histidinol phosphatase-like PHP family hydrolase